MSNPELVKHFMSHQMSAYKYEKTDSSHIIDTLNHIFGNDWTWEVSNEVVLMDGTMIATTVTLYVFGRVLTGRYACNANNCGESHLHALLSAYRMLDNGSGNTILRSDDKNLSHQVKETPAGMTPEQIMNAVNGTEKKPASTYKVDASKFPVEPDIPFYFGPNDPNAPKDAQQPAQDTPQQPSQSNPNTNVTSDYDTPQAKLNGFTQHQIDRMNQFKKDQEIINSEMFGNYVHMWNPNFVSKMQITPENIEDFLAWAERLGKTGS